MPTTLTEIINNDKFNKLIDDIKQVIDSNSDRPCSAVIYSDGGSRDGAGVGIHGYIHTDEIVKHKSKCPNGYPTAKGYTLKKVGDELVNCVWFFDLGISVGDTTNNYAELFGVLIVSELVLRIPELARIRLFTDSKYAVDGLTNYLSNWKTNGWRTSTGKPIANVELWQYWCDKYQWLHDGKKPKLIIKWVKGHDGDIGNEHADALATRAIILGKSKVTDDKLIVKCGSPDTYHNHVSAISHMLSERRLILNSNNPDNEYYFQMTMGGRWPASEEERREQLGKRISDTCVSLVKLKEPDPVIRQIETIARGVADMSKTLVCRLDLLSQGTLYTELKQTGFATTDIRSDKMVTAEGVEFVNELTQPRLSFRLDKVVTELADLLDLYTGNFEGELGTKLDIIDVTNQYFEIKHEKKGEVYSFNDYNVDGLLKVKIKPSFAGEETVELVGGVDLPSNLAMKRLAKLNPKASLLVWLMEDNPRVMCYATVFETVEGVGVWQSAYFSMHVLKS